MRWLSCVGVIAVGAGCVQTQHAVRADDAAATPAAAESAAPAGAPSPDAPAPLDPEIAALPNARGYWMNDAQYGAVYVVTVGPALGAAPAPALLLVHGLGTNGMRDFYPVLAPLAAKRRVIMLDLPGFGRSGRANLKYEPEGYAAVLSRVIAGHGPAPVDVIGHSMGGAITLFHAAAYPEQVRKLIVVDAAGILHRDAWFGHHLRRVTDPARLVLPRVAEMLGEVGDLLTETSRIIDPAPDIVLELAPLRQKLLGGKPERIAALGLILTDFGKVIAHIRAPTLIVWGADDMVAPLRTGLMLADRVPDAELVVFPGVGHQVMAQAPSLLVPQIERHLGAAPVASKRRSAFGPVAGAHAPPPAAVTPAAATSPAPPSKGKAVCSGQSDVVLSGVYDSVVIEDCTGVTLEQVRTTSVVIRRSTASIVRSSITEGITVDASTVMITGGDLGGEIALDVKDSKVDLAGVAIDARREPFRTTGQSRVLLSVCPVLTVVEGVHYRHGFVNVAPAPAR